MEAHIPVLFLDLNGKLILCAQHSIVAATVKAALTLFDAISR